MAGLLPELGAGAWALLATAAVLVGISKTAVPGLGTVSTALFAAILPAKASTAALLLLLIVGDVFALAVYRKHADWPTLVRLIPGVAVGLAFGAVFLAVASDDWVRRSIGAILLALLGVTLWQRRTRRAVPGSGPEAGPDPGAQRLARAGYGSLAGFTTMVANAGGAAMSMYLLASRFPVQAFLGTAAWFFAVINLTKVPISIGLGLITPTTLVLDLLLVPGVILGALIGRAVATRISQGVFERAVIAVTALGALYLLIG